MSSGGLDRAVGREGECEAPYERRTEREPQRAEPGGGRSACAGVRQQRERVPCHDGPEERVEGPKDDRERPAGEVRAFWRLGLEAVRIEPRRAPLSELVPRQPEVVRRLQVVAGRDDVRAR